MYFKKINWFIKLILYIFLKPLELYLYLKSKK